MRGRGRKGIREGRGRRNLGHVIDTSQMQHTSIFNGLQHISGADNGSSTSKGNQVAFSEVRLESSHEQRGG